MRSTCRVVAGGLLFLVASVGALIAIGTQPVQAAGDACEGYKEVNGFVPHETFDPYPADQCTKLIRASGPPVILGIDVTGTTLRFDGISSNEPAGLVGAIYYLDNPYIHDVSVVLARDYREPTPIIYNRGTKVEADATLPIPGIRYGPGATGEWIASWIAPAGAYTVIVRPSSPLTLDQVISRLIVLPPAPPAVGNSLPLPGQMERWRPLGLLSLSVLSALCLVAGVLKLRHAGQFREVAQTWNLPSQVSGVTWRWLPVFEVAVGTLGGMALVSSELRLAASLSMSCCSCCSSSARCMFSSARPARRAVALVVTNRPCRELLCCEVQPCWQGPC